MESSSSSSSHSIVKVILGLIAFTIFWVLAVFPAVPLLPIGRTSGSLLGGMLMVLFQVISPDQAYAAINLPILGLLFGTMVVSVYLERADMFIYIGKLLSWKSRGGKDMVCRICFISAISSAFFTNDTTCIVLTEFVLKIARKHKLPPYPLLLGLASSANIGSSVTPIGNPQNLVIAIQSKISFWSFVMGILPAMLVGLVVNVVLLLCMYWRVLSDEYKHEEEEKEEEDDFSSVDELDDIIVSHRFSPATMSHVTTPERTDKIPNSNSHSRSFMSGPLILNSSIDPNSSGLKIYSSSARFASCRTSNIALDETVANRQDKNSTHRVVVTDHIEVENNNNTSIIAVKKWWIIDEKMKLMLWKGCVYVITIGMLVALVMGLDMSWTAITAALSLMILDFKDARPSLEKVSYSLLVFFCGMFITIDGFNKTGIPGKLWDIMEPYSNTDHPANIAVLAIVILLLSNVASNVPTVLLLGGRVAGSAALLSKTHEKKAWLILAWVSTVAGNLSLLGSAANLIVCEQARRATPKGYNLTFWSHLKFGLPSTLIITAIGLTLIR